ncbi:hypothetical protein OK006_8477 [Actinobacteria bacterium OK006]|nr:hypothetical protein OK006_8477 [Actinobacteria bacterium OK006]
MAVVGCLRVGRGCSRSSPRSFRGRCFYRGAVLRTLRHTPGAALIASVSTTAATTPSHGSSKREPPRMPMTW